MTEADSLKERLRELKNVGGFDDAVSGDHCRGMWVEDPLQMEALARIEALEQQHADTIALMTDAHIVIREEGEYSDYKWEIVYVSLSKDRAEDECRDRIQGAADAERDAYDCHYSVHTVPIDSVGEWGGVYAKD